MATPLAPARADTPHRKQPQAYSAAPPSPPCCNCSIVASLVAFLLSYCCRRPLLVTWLLLLLLLSDTHHHNHITVFYYYHNARVAAEAQLNPSQRPRRVWDPGIRSDVLGRWSSQENTPSWCRALLLHTANSIDEPLIAVKSISSSSKSLSSASKTTAIKCYCRVNCYRVNSLNSTAKACTTVQSKLLKPKASKTPTATICVKSVNPHLTDAFTQVQPKSINSKRLVKLEATARDPINSKCCQAIESLNVVVSQRAAYPAFVSTVTSATVNWEVDTSISATDKRQFFTVKSPNNKGRNTVNNTLKRNFPTLMFHQKNSC